MPPDISAGLTALAAAPPGAAFSAGMPLPEPLGASLFAAFLAQSSPPSVTPAAPKAAATQMPPADPKQMPLEKPPLLKSKTMDTLPMLSLTPKTKVKASELPFQTAKHQKNPEDQASAGGTPTLDTPSRVPALTSQSTAPLLLAASALPLPPVVVPLPALVVPAAAAPPAQAVPAQAVPERAAPVLQGRPDTPAFIPLRAAVPVQATPVQTTPVQTGLPLPRTWSLTAPLQPGQPASALGAEQGAGLKAVSITGARPAAVKTAASGLPRIPSPVSFAPVQTGPQAQGGPQEARPDLPPSMAQAVPQNTPIPSPAVTVTAAAPLAAALPASATPKSGLAKTTGKSLPAALKPAGQNADTSTRATAGQERAVGAKPDVPAAAPEPAVEKHAEEQKPSGTAGSGTNSVPLLPQIASAETGKAAAGPLSAQDRAEVVRQAAEAVTKAPLPAKPGTSEQMSVQLHPKDWGSLQVSVSVAPSQNAGAAKTVTAHIVAETPQVKAALQSGTGALHQALRASGLHLEHLTVSVKAPEGKAPEVKPAAQSGSAGFSSGQGQSDKSEQSYGQPNAGAGGGTNGLANGLANGFGTGGSPNHRQGQPQAFMPAMPDAEPDDAPTASLLRLAAGRIDTHA